MCVARCKWEREKKQRPPELVGFRHEWRVLTLKPSARDEFGLRMWQAPLSCAHREDCDTWFYVVESWVWKSLEGARKHAFWCFHALCDEESPGAKNEALACAGVRRSQHNNPRLSPSCRRREISIQNRHASQVLTTTKYELMAIQTVGKLFFAENSWSSTRERCTFTSSIYWTDK